MSIRKMEKVPASGGYAQTKLLHMNQKDGTYCDAGNLAGPAPEGNRVGWPVYLPRNPGTGLRLQRRLRSATLRRVLFVVWTAWDIGRHEN